MNIRQLQIFKAVCKNLSFTKTAKQLYMSQPAISHTISDLEAEVGCTLLDRINHKIYINDAGYQFLNKANQILELYEDLENNFLKETKTVIKIGSSITIAGILLPSLIQEFQEMHPEIQIKVVVDKAKNIENKLLNNEVDIAFIEGIIQHPMCVSHPFSKFKLLAVCSPLHPFSKHSKITINDLANSDVLLREKGSAIRSCVDHAFISQNIVIEPTWTSVNSQVLIQATLHNLGITILPETLLTSQLKNKELLKIEIENLSLSNHNYLVYHKNKILSSSLQSFIHFIQQSSFD